MSSAAGAYGALLRRRGVGWQAATGLLAQVSQGAGAVGIILVIKQHSGSLALGGAIVGALSIAAGVARPLQGRVIDRRGSVGVMALCGVVHASALGAIVGLSASGVAGPVLVAVGALAGVALPPVSTSMRVVWGDAVGASERLSAYSLTYLVQELAILAGPLLLAGVVAVSSASLALVAVAVVSGAGTLGFAASVRGDGVDRRAAAAPGESARRSSRVRMLIVIALLVGGVVGGIEVAAPATATAHHAPAAGGLLIAALSVGGIAGAAMYGSRTWRSAAVTRMVALLAGLAVPVLVGAWVGDLVALGALLVLTGVCLNPALTTISVLVDEHTPGRTAAEAFGWLSTGFAAGAGAASAIAGTVAGRNGGGRPALLVAAAAGAAATGLAAAARRSLGAR